MISSNFHGAYQYSSFVVLLNAPRDEFDRWLETLPEEFFRVREHIDVDDFCDDVTANAC